MEQMTVGDTPLTTTGYKLIPSVVWPEFNMRDTSSPEVCLALIWMWSHLQLAKASQLSTILSKLRSSYTDVRSIIKSWNGT